MVFFFIFFMVQAFVFMASSLRRIPFVGKPMWSNTEQGLEGLNTGIRRIEGKEAIG